jgi:hypothetical protein
MGEINQGTKGLGKIEDEEDEEEEDDWGGVADTSACNRRRDGYRGSCWSA